MVTKTIDMQNVHMSLEEVVSLVRKGAEVIFTDASIPLARMIPMENSPKARIPELHAGAIQTSDDFDDPLPDEFWMGHE